VLRGEERLDLIVRGIDVAHAADFFRAFAAQPQGFFGERRFPCRLRFGPRDFLIA